jgi:hypothetical protein
MSSFNIQASSKLKDNTLAQFVSSPVQDDLSYVPGLGGSGKIAESLRRNGITSTYQLIGKFLELRGPDMTSVENCNRFAEWLTLKGASGNSRNYIVRSIAEKCSSIMPGIFDVSEFPEFNKD